VGAHLVLRRPAPLDTLEVYVPRLLDPDEAARAIDYVRAKRGVSGAAADELEQLLAQITGHAA
jgi:hypothetical protein